MKKEEGGGRQLFDLVRMWWSDLKFGGDVAWKKGWGGR